MCRKITTRFREELRCDVLFTYWPFDQSALTVCARTLNDIVYDRFVSDMYRARNENVRDTEIAFSLDVR